MGDKVTIILMKVDLQCDRCYKKIRRVLCKFPEIRDQVYDEKLNVVKITVVSCCPEFIMKKIASKGGKSIEKMEMMSLDKKKPAEEKPKEGGGEKKKDDKPKEGGGGGEKKKDDKPKEGGGGGGEKKKDGDGEKKKEGGGGGGGGGGEKKKDGGGGGGGGGGEKKKEGGGGGGGGEKGAPEKKEGGGGGGGGGKEKGPAPEKKDGGGEHYKLVREAPVPVSGYPSIFPPVYPIQASYPGPPPYYPQPVYGYGPVHNPGPYQQYYNGMPGYDHYHRVGGTQYGDQYGPYYEENESTCTIM